MTSMTETPFLRVGAALVAVLALSGCSDAPSDPAPITAPPLAASTWYVHAIGTTAVPAMVSRVSAGDHLEETVVDSATFRIIAGGRYEFQSWITVYRGWNIHVTTTWREQGSWRLTDTGYEFRSDGGDPRGIIVDVDKPERVLQLRVVTDLAVREVTLRPTLPPKTAAGAWRASAVGANPVPSTVYVFTGVIEDGREISSHFVLDSARLQLLPSGRYLHRVWYTEWEGDVGGPPRSVRVRFYHSDFGAWSHTEGAVRLESGWIQNYRLSGTLDSPADAVRLAHGLTPGDEVVAISYTR